MVLLALLLRQQCPPPGRAQPVLREQMSLLGLVASCLGGPGWQVRVPGRWRAGAACLPGVRAETGVSPLAGSRQVYLWTQVMLAGGVASASGLAGLLSSPWRAGRRGWGGAEVSEASPAWAGLGWCLEQLLSSWGLPAPHAAPQPRSSHPVISLASPPQPSLLPLTSCTRPAHMCVHTCHPNVHTHGSPDLGFCCPRSRLHSPWVQGLGERSGLGAPPKEQGQR